tara:strand:- start:180 stop:692 length:513 start_codon:yes stop_codon:yes gene_type:complete
MIVLGLGSNLSSKFGDRFTNLEKAISLLESHGIKILKKSSFYETPSYPNKNNPKFINIVILVYSDLKPENLASVLIAVENELQRKRYKKNEPRTCDIDIIDYKGESFNFKFNDLKFTVPHIELTNRNFVLYPLKEILPNWKHPKSKVIIDILIKNLCNDFKKSILKVKKC